MYDIGQQLQGERYDDQGEIEILVGGFVAITDDPEEYIQDIILDVPGRGRLYFDEQGVRPVICL